MMLSEFEKLTGLEVTTAEYEKIEAEYMESPDDKAKFCKMWLKKGGLQRLHNARLEEIEHLKKTIEDLEHKLDEEQDWQISHKYGTHYQKTSYDHLTKRCSNGHQFESEAKAAEFISSQYGFDKDRIVFIHDVEVYETNRHEKHFIHFLPFLRFHHEACLVLGKRTGHSWYSDGTHTQSLQLFAL